MNPDRKQVRFISKELSQTSNLQIQVGVHGVVAIRRLTPLLSPNKLEFVYTAASPKTLRKVKEHRFGVKEACERQRG